MGSGSEAPSMSQSGGYIGSDWRSTVYSRGPVNQPSNPDRFRMFTQNADFIPNEQLRTAKFMKGGKKSKKSKK